MGIFFKETEGENIVSWGSLIITPSLKKYSTSAADLEITPQTVTVQGLVTVRLAYCQLSLPERGSALLRSLPRFKHQMVLYCWFRYSRELVSGLIISGVAFVADTFKKNSAQKD